MNFLIELDNLVCQVVLTDTHLENFEAKLLLAYIMYGERTIEEIDALGRGPNGDTCILTLRNWFQCVIDNVFAPVLLLVYYLVFTTPIIIFFCF